LPSPIITGQRPPAISRQHFISRQPRRHFEFSRFYFRFRHFIDAAGLQADTPPPRRLLGHDTPRRYLLQASSLFAVIRRFFL